MTSDPLILAIETSGPAGSTALLRGATVLAEQRFEPGARGGSLLHPGVVAVLAAAGGARPDLVAVGVGPGSYTGARIGVTFAKIYAFGRGVPLHGVCALEAIALRARPSGRTAVLMNAHPGHCYAALYACAEGSPPAVVRAPALVPRDAFLAELAGDEAILEAPPEQSWAADVGGVAARRGGKGAILDPGALEPLYLQAPSPERVSS
jgi:tRNA threonylcarbamoyl adenosine modification protein YeaZ